VDGTIKIIIQVREYIVMSKRKYIVRYWLVGSIFAFFPFIAIVIMSMFSGNGVDIERVIGDGELVLSSFLIVVPSLVSNYRSKSTILNNKYKEIGERFYLILLLLAFLSLTIYVSIKMSENVPVNLVYIVSAICVMLSIMISWGNEAYLQEVGK